MKKFVTIFVKCLGKSLALWSPNIVIFLNLLVELSCDYLRYSVSNLPNPSLNLLGSLGIASIYLFWTFGGSSGTFLAPCGPPWDLLWSIRIKKDIFKIASLIDKMPAITLMQLYQHQTCDSHRFVFLAALLKSSIGWPLVGNSTSIHPSHGRVSLPERKPRNLEVLIPGQTGGKVLEIQAHGDYRFSAWW